MHIDPTAWVHPTATFGPGATVGPFAVVGERSVVGPGCTLHAGALVGRACRLGEGVVVHPRASVTDGSVLGDRAVVHANAVLGADGFGYRTQAGRHVKVPQVGWVEVGDDVEVGACATVDRGTFGPTRVGAGTKVGGLTILAHNCRIGPDNLVAEQVGIAGSTVTGGHVVLAPQAGVVDNVAVGDRVAVGARAAVRKSVAADSRVCGDPAVPEEVYRLNQESLAGLPQLCRDVERIDENLGTPAAVEAARPSARMKPDPGGTGGAPAPVGSYQARADEPIVPSNDPRQ